MFWFLGQMLLVVGIFVGTGLTGHAVMQISGPPFLTRRSIERAALIPIVGTAVWVLLFGLLSHLGLRAGAATGIVLGGALLAFVYAWIAHGPPFIWHRRLIALGCYSMLAAGICLLPIALYETFYPMNDSLGAYVLISDWLQSHGYGQTAGSNSYDTLEAAARLYQHVHYRLGSTFLLALVQAAAGAGRALTVYPAVMAWGFILLGLSLFVFARWSLRVPVNYAVLPVACMAIAMNPVRWAATNGFLAQMYGTAGLLTAGAFMARMVQRGTWSLRSGCSLGILSAFLLSAYSEMFPVLGLSFLVYLVVALRHALRHNAAKKLMAMLGVTVLSFVVFSNVELVRGYRAVLYQLGLNSGWHVGLTASEFWAALMGQHYFMTYPAQETGGFFTQWAKVASLLAIPMTALFFIGLIVVVRRDRSRLVITIFGILVTLLVKFGLMTLNPWTGGQANTYIVFKTIQWVFPIILLVQIIGLQSVVRSVRSLATYRHFQRNLLFPGLLSLLAVTWAPIHFLDAKLAWASLNSITDSATPFKALAEMGQAIDTQEWEKLYLL